MERLRRARRTHGTGASRADDALAARLAGGLSSAGPATGPGQATGPGLVVETRVLAVPGARSADLALQVDAVAPWGPDVAVVVIGANDLTHQVPADAAAADLQRAVRRLRRLGAEVVVLPAPDLSVVVHVPAYRGLVQAASALLRAAQARAVRAEGGRVCEVPAATRTAFAGDPSLFSADRFHPSGAGYALIAEAMAPAVRQAAHDATGKRSA